MGCSASVASVAYEKPIVDDDVDWPEQLRVVVITGERFAQHAEREDTIAMFCRNFAASHPEYPAGEQRLHCFDYILDPASLNRMGSFENIDFRQSPIIISKFPKTTALTPQHQALIKQIQDISSNSATSADIKFLHNCILTCRELSPVITEVMFAYWRAFFQGNSSVSDAAKQRRAKMSRTLGSLGGSFDIMAEMELHMHEPAIVYWGAHALAVIASSEQPASQTAIPDAAAEAAQEAADMLKPDAARPHRERRRTLESSSGSDSESERDPEINRNTIVEANGLTLMVKLWEAHTGHWPVLNHLAHAVMCITATNNDHKLLAAEAGIIPLLQKALTMHNESVESLYMFCACIESLVSYEEVKHMIDVEMIVVLSTALGKYTQRKTRNLMSVYRLLSLLSVLLQKNGEFQLKFMELSDVCGVGALLAILENYAESSTSVCIAALVVLLRLSEFCAHGIAKAKPLAAVIHFLRLHGSQAEEYATSAVWLLGQLAGKKESRRLILAEIEMDEAGLSLLIEISAQFPFLKQAPATRPLYKALKTL
eukprot:TRINITY_DN15720_c0_g1_i1.p1 TRINITY_DN15720_c0_g1~~TRINITY_DN15720_c0_g1_i1.p1  ORF type:complete len:541 (-),score=84.60 TRINITY_DN15720_c0_g1_i1:201-1823(-)